MDVIIYHNAKCSKSRQALELLKSRGIEPEIIEYLETPPTRDRLAQSLQLLKLTPRELLRSSEAAYRDNGLHDPNLSPDQLLDALVRHPILLQRPIVLANGKAAIGRPPENVLDIL